MTDLQEQVKAIQGQILAEGWFCKEWIHALAQQGFTAADVVAGQLTDRQLIELCHEMWEALPDDPSCRTGPFFQLCDVAERIFD